MSFCSTLRRGALAGIVCLTTTAASAEPFSPILTETAGRGPQERVQRFKVNPLAEFYPLDRAVPLSPPIRAAIEAGKEDRRDLRQTIEDQAFRQGVSVFSISLGIDSALNTLLEQGYVDDLFPDAASRVVPKLGTGLTYLGLALTVYQIALGPASGDGRPEILNAYKGVLSYLLGRFGTPGIQLAMIAGLPIDISLNFFGDAAWSAREDAWRQSYRKYYREMEAGAKRAALGSVGRFPPTLEERVADIRARREGGRTINEWKILLEWYLRNINRPDKFSRVIETEVRNYAAKFWDSSRFDEYAADVDQSTAGYARGASLTKAIKDKLEAEHYSIIMAKMIRDVLPEITRDRWLKALKAQADKLNREVRPELNAPITIEVAAFGIEGATKFHMLLADGDTWTGTLTPCKSLRLQMTKFAWVKAGFPDTIRLDAPDGAVERKFTLADDAAEVVFGNPESTGPVATLTRTEGPQECTITARGGGKPARQTTEQRPPRPGTTLQSAATAAGCILIGRYDGSEWSAASMGKALEDGTGTDFAAPRFDGIARLSNCRIDKIQTFSDLMGDTKCRVNRLYTERTSDGRDVMTRCSADMTLEIEGVWTTTDGEWRYVPFARDQLDEIGREYQKMLDKLPGAGMQ
jgi:hypothetical protein